MNYNRNISYFKILNQEISFQITMNFANVLELFYQTAKTRFNFDTCVTTTITKTEQEAAFKLFEIFSDIVLESEILDNDDGLKLKDSDESDSDEEMNIDKDSDYSPDDEDEDDKVNKGQFSFQDMVFYVEERKRLQNWKFESFRNKYRKIKNPTMLHRFSKIIENGGTKQMKYDFINEHVYDKFVYARDRKFPVHNKDLRRWGVKKSKDLNITFKASESWVENLKRRNRITSRKAKIVSNRAISDAGSILDSANSFREDIRKETWKWPIVLNTDQIGFVKEIHSTRTLSHKNEKTTFLAVRSMNNCTHSYTVQPTISLDGQLCSNFFLCLYEPTGKIGPTVKYFQAKNVVVTCSSSGKLSKGHVIYWLNNCLKPVVKNDEFMLILDSWSTQTNTEMYDNLFGSKYHLKIIPPHTTSIAQPLDVGFNYWWKFIARRIADRVVLDEIDINMGIRDNIIKEQSLIHNQLCSPKFNDLIKYAFFKSGLTQDHPGSFLDIREVCFPSDIQDCSVTDCENCFLIQCSHCEANLCFKHFFIDYHAHF